jgi:hypothetical protein
MPCDAIPRTVISCLLQSDGTSFHHQSRWSNKKSSLLGDMSSKQLWWHMHACLLCSFVRNQGTQWEQTFCNPKVSIFSCTAWRSTSSCAVISLTVTLWSSLISATTSLFHSVVPLLGRPQSSDWAAVPSCKCFIWHSGAHALRTLVEVAHRCLHLSCSASTTAQWRNDVIDSHLITVDWWCTLQK